MTQSLPPASRVPSDPASARRDSGRLTPLWMLVAAIIVLLAGVSLLLVRPLSRWSAGMQPTPTETLMPTRTPSQTPTFVPTQVPTRTPTLVPTEGADSARSNPLFELAADLRSIHMVDRNNGWGLGQYSLWYTRDGGQSWEDVTPALSSRLPGSAVHVVDQVTAWFFDTHGAIDFSGRLYLTRDSGKTWSFRETWFGGEAPNIFFLEDDLGWVLTSSYNFTREVYRTQDHGINWSAVHRVAQQQEGRMGFLPDIGFLRGPVFLDPEHGWMGGTTRIEDGSSFIYESTDGGRLWMLRHLEMETGFGSMWISAPRFFGQDKTVGLMVAYAAPIDEIVNAQGIFNENQFGVTPVDLPRARYVIFASTNQGSSWEETSWVEISNPSPFSLATQQNFFVLDGGRMLVSADAGKTWEPVESNLSDLTGGEVQISGIQFVDGQVGWGWGTADERLRLYQTKDGGAFWKEIDLLQ
jgi:photosystem II stability/assembly factor-like uncharacterized protein